MSGITDCTVADIFNYMGKVNEKHMCALATLHCGFGSTPTLHQGNKNNYNYNKKFAALLY